MEGAAHRAAPLADSPTSCPLSTESKKHCHRRTTEHEPNRVANSSSVNLKANSERNGAFSGDSSTNSKSFEGKVHLHRSSLSDSKDVAKVQQNFETTKDLAKKSRLLSYHSAPIAGASARRLRRMESCLSVVIGSCSFLRHAQTYRCTRNLSSFSNIRQWLFHPLFQGCPAVPKYPELLLPLAGCKDTKKNWYYVNFHLIFCQANLIFRQLSHDFTSSTVPSCFFLEVG